MVLKTPQFVTVIVNNFTYLFIAESMKIRTGTYLYPILVLTSKTRVLNL